MLVKAHAKINLALDVLGLRPDGYHELESVMQSLSLHDVIELSPGPQLTLEVLGANISSGPDNLALRAAHLLRRHTGYSGGASIRLHKRIPVAAGLAGGSTDAASVLRGLNKMWDLGLSTTELAALGAEIGSDVPFCVYGGTALCRGRGELVTPLPDLPAAGVLLVKPAFGVSTAEVYRRYDGLSTPHRPHSGGMAAAVRRGDLDRVAAGLGNALEQVTEAMYPVIRAIKQEITSAGARGVLMSGSGPTVFGIFTDPAEAARAAKDIDKQDRWVMATSFAPAFKEHE